MRNAHNGDNEQITQKERGIAIGWYTVLEPWEYVAWAKAAQQRAAQRDLEMRGLALWGGYAVG